jgi:hypothetical protein
MGALNIKDADVAAKARKLAKLTGKSIAAVSEALDTSLRTAKHKAGLDRQAHRREEDKILRRIRAKVPPDSPVWNRLEDMYDENGLPK